MNRVINIPRRITDKRKDKKGKLALAVWLGVKFAFGNSTKYDMSKNGIKEFFHCGDKYAKDIIHTVWEDNDLFYANKTKNCLFAKSQKNKDVKVARTKRKQEYISDDVITVNVPEVYLRDNGDKETLPLKQLLELVDYILICKEYDQNLRYKLSYGDARRCEDICETERRKSMSYVAKKVGLNRTTLIRRVKALAIMGYVLRGGGEKNDYGLNAPSFLTLTDACPFIYRHIIWNCAARVKSKRPKKKFLDASFMFDASNKEHVDFYFSFQHD